MTGSFRRPPDWTIEESPWQPHQNAAWESRGTLANGYLAMRGYPEEPFVAGPTRRSILLGLPAEAGGAARVSDFLAVAIVLDGHAVVLAPGRVAGYRRTLDLAGGLLQRRLHYHVDARTTALAFERFASLSNPHVAAQSITITPLDWAGSASLWFWFDPRAAEQAGGPLRLLQASHVGRQRVLISTQTQEAKLRIVHAARCSGWVHRAVPPLPSLVRDGSQIALRYDVRLERAQRAVFERVVSTCTSIDPEVTSAERSALEEVRGNTGPEYGTRRRKHLRAWRRRWERHDIALRGPREDQRTIRFAVFHLVQACPSSARPGAGHPQVAARQTPPLVGSAAEALALVPFLTATDLPAARELLVRLGRRGLAARSARAAAKESLPPSELVPAAWHYLQSSRDASFREGLFRPLLLSAARGWEATPPRRADDALTAAWALRLAASELAPQRGAEKGRRAAACAVPVSASERSRWLALARTLAPRGAILPAGAASLPLRTLNLSALVPAAVPKRVLRALADRCDDATRLREDTGRLAALQAIAGCDLGDPDRALEWLRAALPTEHDRLPPGGSPELRYDVLAAVWLVFTRGFLRLRVKKGRLLSTPRLPRAWASLGMMEPVGTGGGRIGGRGVRADPEDPADAPRAAPAARLSTPAVPRGLRDRGWQV